MKYEDLAEHKQLVPLLKEHHDYLEESISYLLDNDSTDFQKQEHLERFFRLLEMHAKAEEETLYKHLQENTAIEGRLEAMTGKTEHEIVFQLEAELLFMDYKNEWTEEIEAKAKVAALQMKNHINEEEDTMFSIAKSHMTLEELEELRDIYIQSCISYLGNDINTPTDIYVEQSIIGRHTDFGTDSFH